MKLDLGCGDNKREGFTGVDKFKTSSTDVVHDLLTYPWPFEDGSVDEIFSSHFLEHIPGHDRPKFMDEVYRVLKPGAKAVFVTPYYSSMRAVQDFTHAWPPLSDMSFYYFNKTWRETNKLTHGYYEMVCDFDVLIGHAYSPMVAVRNAEYQQYAARHYVNAVDDIHAHLTKRINEPAPAA